MKPHIQAAGWHYNSLVGMFNCNIGGGVLECTIPGDDVVGTGSTAVEAYAAWKLAKERRGDHETWEKRRAETYAKDDRIYTFVRLGLFALLAILICWVL